LIGTVGGEGQKDEKMGKETAEETRAASSCIGPERVKLLADAGAACIRRVRGLSSAVRTSSRQPQGVHDPAYTRTSGGRNADTWQDAFLLNDLYGTRRVYRSFSRSLPIGLCLLPGNGLVKTLLQQGNTPQWNNWKSDLCVVSVILMDSLWVDLCMPVWLLVNGSVNTLPRLSGIVGGVVFYAVLVLPRTFIVQTVGFGN
jgi:hypothetical protein